MGNAASPPKGKENGDRGNVEGSQNKEQDGEHIHFYVDLLQCHQIGGAHAPTPPRIRLEAFSALPAALTISRLSPRIARSQLSM